MSDGKILKLALHGRSVSTPLCVVTGRGCPPPVFAENLQALTFPPIGARDPGLPLRITPYHRNMAKLVMLFLKR
jgi:hypothetical protein